MKVFILKSIKEVQEEKHRAIVENAEKTEELTARRTKLQTMNKEIREANKSTGRCTAPKHNYAWGVDQRVFSTAALKRRQLEDQELREKRRAERQIATEQGRARIGLDLIPECTFPVRKNLERAEESDAPCLTLREANPEAREYMELKRKRDLNLMKLRELQEEQKELRRERALETLEKDRKRGLKSRSSRKIKQKKPIPHSSGPPKSFPVQLSDVSLRKQLRELLKEKAKVLRDSVITFPSSLDYQPSFPSDSQPCLEESSSRTQTDRSKRRLKRRAELLQERYLQAREPEEKENYETSDFLTEVKRDLAARLIQRQFRMYRLKRRLCTRDRENESLTSGIDFGSSFRSESENLTLKSYQEILHLENEEKLLEELQGKSVSDVAIASDSCRSDENTEAQSEVLNRFRDALQRHYEKLEVKFLKRRSELEEGLAAIPPVVVEESLLQSRVSSPLAQINALAFDGKSFPEYADIPETGSIPCIPSTENKSPIHLLDSPSTQQIFQIPLTEVRPTETAENGLVDSSKSDETSGWMDREAHSVDNLPLTPLGLERPATFSSPQGLISLTRVPAQSEYSEPTIEPCKRHSHPNLRLELDDGNVRFLTLTEVRVDSPVLSPIASLESPEAGGPSQEKDGLHSEGKTQIREVDVDEIVQRLIDREVMAYLPKEKPPASVDRSPEFLCYFLELLVEQMDETHFMEEATRPRPVNLLTTLSNLAYGCSSSLCPIEVLIPTSAFRNVTRQFTQQGQDPESATELAAYCRLLYDSANEAINVIRPESLKGDRTPWRPGPADLHKYKSIFEVFYDVRDLMFAWESAEVGRIIRDDCEMPAIAAQIQEEHLSTQLLRDVPFTQVLLEDHNWSDYEQEDAQTKLDLADVLLSVLVQDTAVFLSNLRFSM